ncbi:MAG: DUF2628 domain-containing protein [Rhodospirillales bacterium]|nr:DUF2628 domain-containing protein [Rhodospirillales bacterium]MBN8897473.1 DUF2628 domain-containing protein [Rhodospirillales bacterium]
MTSWTAHLRRDAEPLLLRDGFSWGCLCFGPFWLAAHRAWLPAALSLAAWGLAIALTPGPMAKVVLPALAWLHGLSGNDLRRWSLSLRGYVEGPVLVAGNELEALRRLVAARPELMPAFAPAETAR